VAAILAWADVPLAGEWAAFVGISVATLVAMRPLARRLDRDGDSEGVGSRRLIGRTGDVREACGPHDPGLGRVAPEAWRADTLDRSPVPVGAAVRITEVEGTRVIVTLEKEHTE